MKIPIAIFLTLAMPAISGVGFSTASAAEKIYYAGQTPVAGPNVSEKFLKQAREYREKGRYELARQAYAQALSTCRSSEEVAAIKHEMGGVELLLRTLR
ncbi:MAG: hypothetical protein LBC94_04290 [Desulfovibrio sp.]|jgi:hypothetical protein|nr:hypothetical protein [Desulfovibrio sp.]